MFRNQANNRSNETNGKSLIPITKSNQKLRLENTQIYTTIPIRKELL